MRHRKQRADHNGYTDEDDKNLTVQTVLVVAVAVSLFLSALATTVLLIEYLHL